MTVALLLPVTFALEPTSAFIMFAGIYYGGMYGGSTTSILLEHPGECSIGGHRHRGPPHGQERAEPPQALATAAIGSFVAGTIGTVLLVALAPRSPNVAVSMGAPEYFAVMADRLRRGHRGARPLAAARVCRARHGPGHRPGRPGHSTGPAAAAPSACRSSSTASTSSWSPSPSSPSARRSGSRATCAEPAADHPGRPALDEPRGLERSWQPWLRGTAFGFPFGAIPAGGAEIPTFLSYAIERKLSKHPEEFGKGAIEGVAGPEAANNASAAGVLVPLLTLGLPTTATAAIMLAAFPSYGIQPGPQLLESEPDAGLGSDRQPVHRQRAAAGDQPAAGAASGPKLLQIPRPYLYAGILFFAVLGAYAVNLQPFDLFLLIIPASSGSSCDATACRSCRSSSASSSGRASAPAAHGPVRRRR